MCDVHLFNQAVVGDDVKPETLIYVNAKSLRHEIVPRKRELCYDETSFVQQTSQVPCELRSTCICVDSDTTSVAIEKYI